MCLHFFQKLRLGVQDLQIGKELCVPQGTEKKAHKANFKKTIHKYFRTRDVAD